MTDNEIKDLKIGQRVHDTFFDDSGTVSKVGKNKIWIKFDDGKEDSFRKDGTYLKDNIELLKD